MNASEFASMAAVAGLRVGRQVAVAAALCAASLASAAPSVSFLAVDLTDVVPGEDLWAYDYTLTGPLGEFESVNLLFSPMSYTDLLVTSSDARLFVLDPTPAFELTTPILLTATAMEPIAADAPAQLSVQFVWLSSGAPGAQPFELLDGGFNVTASGVTSPVPEASSAALLFAGLLGLGALLRRRMPG